MGLNVELVKRGKKEPLEGLKAQGRNHLELLTAHAVELKAEGWENDETTELAKNVELISTNEAARSDAADSARLATNDQESVIDESKALIQGMRNVQDRVLRLAAAAGVVIDKELLSTGKLKRSVPAIVSYLTNAEPAVKRLDPYFAKAMKNVAPSPRMAELRKKLETADTKQEAAIDSTPELTAKIYEAKGRVLRAIEEINGMAKNAFRGNAEVIGKFNKDLLLRARRERAKATVTPA